MTAAGDLERPAEPADVVRSFWERIQARDWVAVRSLLSDQVTLHFVVTDEIFDGPDNVVAINAEYPEGWSIELLSVTADGARVVAEIQVPQDNIGVFRTVSIATVDGPVITEIREYWVTLGVEDAPVWRRPYRRS